MDTTTQQNAALVEESSAAASSLEDQAVQLEKVVSIFRVAKDSAIQSEKRTLARSNLAALPKKKTSNHENGDWANF